MNDNQLIQLDLSHLQEVRCVVGLMKEPFMALVNPSLICSAYPAPMDPGRTILKFGPENFLIADCTLQELMWWKNSSTKKDQS